ncbi:hypothetical protein AYR56_10045 [Loigolactobacillus backii]|uniref:Uncharacterized protein n=1 Tax=Loigolactobacillus backii TaxID=375175 RepID=A0A192H2S1_9LACO|nr:hypothetical protein AYR53_06955 [Loigolactobacillus backii]ANK70463.1 hypothetical protein AYR56_10045 [Loigolactobacillus backii]
MGRFFEYLWVFNRNWYRKSRRQENVFGYSLWVLQYLLLVIDFHLLLMTDFLFMARIKKRTFPVRSSKSTTTKIFQKEGNALCVMILQNYY